MKKYIIREKLEEFIDLLKSGKIEVYNEFSFQHELGYFLRNQLKHYQITLIQKEQMVTTKFHILEVHQIIQIQD